jgi:hypothetical protein
MLWELSLLKGGNMHHWKTGLIIGAGAIVALIVRSFLKGAGVSATSSS